jgi:excisionase family DNA binding protein
MQQSLDLPNPDAWCDRKQAAAILDVSNATLYDMVQRGSLGDYKIGSIRVFWRAEVIRLRDARAVVAGRA